MRATDARRRDARRDGHSLTRTANVGRRPRVCVSWSRRPTTVVALVLPFLYWGMLFVHWRPYPTETSVYIRSA